MSVSTEEQLHAAMKAHERKLRSPADCVGAEAEWHLGFALSITGDNCYVACEPGCEIGPFHCEFAHADPATPGFHWHRDDARSIPADDPRFTDHGETWQP